MHVTGYAKLGNRLHLHFQYFQQPKTQVFLCVTSYAKSGNRLHIQKSEFLH